VAAQIGGSTAMEELSKLSDMTGGAVPIQVAEFETRITRMRGLMRKRGVEGVFVNAGTNLFYFTGIEWTPSERLVGAFVPLQGDIVYIAPEFERGTLEGFIRIDGEIRCWQEHENPYELLVKQMPQRGRANTALALDETTPFFVSEGIRQAMTEGGSLVSAGDLTGECRMRKSASEIALIKRAMEMTIEVQKAAARIMRPGITAQEVTEFIHAAHKAVGAPAGSTFCIVLFGADTAFPHGVKLPKPLGQGEFVLVDTGCRLHGYLSDITRTYVYGDASPRQEKVWRDEREAQFVAFAAAQSGSACGAVDDAVRAFIEQENYGPDYQLPGLSHRTGHGIGLDVHEAPFLVRNNNIALDDGMCFSIEPMLCVPGEFGVRLEDHVYMDVSGPNWFTEPARSLEDPF